MILSLSCSSQNIVGRYVANNVSKTSYIFDNQHGRFETTDLMIHYEISFLDDGTFNYFEVSNDFGLSDVSGQWYIDNNELVLNSQFRNYIVDELPHCEFKDNNYHFYILRGMRYKCNVDISYQTRIDKIMGSYEYPDSHLVVVTTNNDTIINKILEGKVLISKDYNIICFWITDCDFISKKYEILYPESNFFFIKYSPHREFNNERWLIENGKIKPRDPITGDYVDFYLEKTSFPWETKKYSCRKLKK
jgi:hypothetical protein